MCLFSHIDISNDDLFQEIHQSLTSPIPMKARTRSKQGNPIFAATGVRAVAMDHQMTPNPRTRFPPTVSAHIPPAIYRCMFKENDT